MNKRNLGLVSFKELRDKTFEIILIVEMLCEVCEKPLSIREKFLRKVHVKSMDDFERLLIRAGVHDHAEVDFENNKIFFYNKEYSGDIHPECLERL